MPFYRDMARGAEGEDVAHLQQLLVDVGYLDDTPDGEYGASTTAAVREWQRATGQPRTGGVALGTLLALGELPAAVHPAQEFRVGALVVAGGEPAISVLGASPQLTLILRVGGNPGAGELTEGA